MDPSSAADYGAALVTAADDVTGGAVSILTNEGVLGALVVLLGVFALLAYRREVQRADRLEAEITKLRDATEERVIPLIERALSTIEAARHERTASRSSDGP